MPNKRFERSAEMRALVFASASARSS